MSYLALNGVRVNAARLVIPYSGAWTADLELDGAVLPTGPASLVLGSSTLSGTVLSAQSVAWANHLRVRLVGGRGGWRKAVAARAYHDDGGVRRADVLDGLATECGETIVSAGDLTRLGVDFVRCAGTAARALDAILGGVAWWVGLDGVTRYGTRPTATLAPLVELLDVEERGRVAVFGTEDPGAVPIGARFVDSRLGGSAMVREVEFEARANVTRVRAWAVAA